jgi:CheY-like chemotaxis protein
MGTELSGGRVLVFDDDRVNRMLLTRSLEREGPPTAHPRPPRAPRDRERDIALCGAAAAFAA